MKKLIERALRRWWPVSRRRYDEAAEGMRRYQQRNYQVEHDRALEHDAYLNATKRCMRLYEAHWWDHSTESLMLKVNVRVARGATSGSDPRRMWETFAELAGAAVRKELRRRENEVLPDCGTPMVQVREIEP